MPLARGIQRFTGITQTMASSAPLPEEVLPQVAELLHGRVLVAHNA
jgi:DNA polymerase III subunit epsilon